MVSVVSLNIGYTIVHVIKRPITYTSSRERVLNKYFPIVLTCQMHTDYTVSAHDIIIFEKFSVVFVKCTDSNQKLDGFYSSKCGIQSIQTVMADWF